MGTWLNAHFVTTALAIKEQMARGLEAHLDVGGRLTDHWPPVEVGVRMMVAGSGRQEWNGDRGIFKRQNYATEGEGDLENGLSQEPSASPEEQERLRSPCSPSTKGH